jgi:hypothetical protein
VHGGGRCGNGPSQCGAENCPRSPFPGMKTRPQHSLRLGGSGPFSFVQGTVSNAEPESRRGERGKLRTRQIYLFQ